jgi:hypothetical protein
MGWELSPSHFIKQKLMSQLIVPANRPQLSRMEAEHMLQAYPLNSYPVKLLAIRGYFKKTMGNPVQNDFGIYDDAIILVAPKVYKTYNANTDPSVLNSHLAILKTGLHFFKKGKHGISRPGGGYPAFRPANPEEKLPVTRNGKDDWGIAINIHRGGYGQTSSEGCQTIYPDQWEGFQLLVYNLMTQNNQRLLPYALTEI